MLNGTYCRHSEQMAEFMCEHIGVQDLNYLTHAIVFFVYAYYFLILCNAETFPINSNK